MASNNLSSQLLFFLLLAVAIAAAASASQDEEMIIAEDKKCMQEMQQHPLTVCRQFLKHGIGGGTGNAAECCEQLRWVSATCRCELLNMMTGQMMMKEMEGGQCRGRCEEIRMRGAFFPLMCSVGPPCPLSYGGGGIAGGGQY